MNKDVLEYCAKAVIRHLNGDMNQFLKYRNKAIEIYESEDCLCSIGEMIDSRTKDRLYRMVG